MPPLESNTSSANPSPHSLSKSSSSTSVSTANFSARILSSPGYQQRVQNLNSAEVSPESSEGEASASTLSGSRGEDSSTTSSHEGGSVSGSQAGDAVVEARRSWSSSRRRERSSCEDDGDENEGCYTPRGKECMIPQVPCSCPPAPRKRKPGLRLAFSPCHLSGILAVPDFEAFFPRHHQIPLRE